MSQDAVKLIGECSRERLPPHIEQLISDVKAELKDDVTNHDLTVVLLFGLMAETGFTPLSVDDAPSGQIASNVPSVETLKAIRKLPKDWRRANDSQYSMKFYLNTCSDAICQLRASKLKTNATSDSLIVNLFANCSPTAFVLHVQPSRYVNSKEADFENMFDHLDELSLLFKNVVHPLRNGILEKYGQLNASLSGMPTEVKLKIFSYLSVPKDWNALSQTCIDMHILGDDAQLWKLYLQRDFGSVFPHKESVKMLCRSTEEVDWKTEYMERYICILLTRMVIYDGPKTRFVRSPPNPRVDDRHEPDDDKIPPAGVAHSQTSLVSFDPGVDDRLPQTPVFELVDSFACGVHPSPTSSLEVMYIAENDDADREMWKDSDFETDDDNSESGYFECVQESYKSLGGGRPECTYDVYDWSGPSTSGMNYYRGMVTDTLKDSRASTCLSRQCNAEDLKGMDYYTTRELQSMSSAKEAQHGVYRGYELNMNDCLLSCSSDEYFYEAGSLDVMSCAAEPIGDSILRSSVDQDDESDIYYFETGGLDVAEPNSDSNLYESSEPDDETGVCYYDSRGFGLMSCTTGNLKGCRAYTSLIWPVGPDDTSEMSDWVVKDLETLSSIKDARSKNAKDWGPKTTSHCTDYEKEALKMFMTMTAKSRAVAIGTRNVQSSGDLEGYKSPTTKKSDDSKETVMQRHEVETLYIECPEESFVMERPRGFEDGDDLPLTEEISGVRTPSEDECDDLDAVSLSNNVGSAADLAGVVWELERNGDGDADHLLGVGDVPSEYTYKEVQPGDPYE